MSVSVICIYVRDCGALICVTCVCCVMSMACVYICEGFMLVWLCVFGVNVCFSYFCVFMCVGLFVCCVFLCLFVCFCVCLCFNIFVFLCILCV